MRVHKSSSKFLGNLAAGIALLGAAAWAFWFAYNHDGFANFASGLGGFVALIVGIGLGLMAFSESAYATCPACNKQIAELRPVEKKPRFLPCPHCQRYVKQEKDELSVVAEDFVGPTFVFKTSLPERFRWADDGCVQCRAPATRRIEAKVKVSKTGENAAASAAGLAVGGLLGVGFIRTGGGAEYSLEVPHCDEHSDGVRIDEDGGLVILFRSYPYFRDFCAANELKAKR